ncbi:uncharacterized protein M421DRAFT_96697 [Didymella exigua CBS 183.55]|uniref:FAD/NAD(P)-binding domain-containing protein n=1 Tax=Didymella exigua CBS 183.55 TaxID=1150837 RepID=A0A6A5R5B6_9PLEO|nr:uncharacterized protein M421DRAFT_96697 [Didymella exigua CBS 183.55]KAF1922619.1 hypothetical protein M421DRAFT_96697 [Didymella exigua CBS 183.55]
MTPDLNAVSKSERWDYSTPGLSGYNIPDIVYSLVYQIQKHCKDVEHVIYGKNADIGDSWLENRYRVCACNVPSHAYTLNFALNPDWPRFFSYAPDIQKYLLKVVEVFELRKYMTFNTEVIKGMEKFKGRIVYTAVWPEEYQDGKWKSDRVAIIGSGASSIRTVPKMQPHAKHLNIFVRTGVYEGQNAAQKMFRERMKEFLKDERLLQGFTPKFEFGCRRIAQIEAIQNENVDVHFTAVEAINEDGVIGGDGVKRKVDTIICATGFDVTHKPRFPVIVTNNIDLYEKWKKEPGS